jgi:4-diphosphocytidyl-2-C-methyl-D-erythritol kinase
METYAQRCPAKLNLYLAVGGKRADAYHDLASLVVRIGIFDELSASVSDSGRDELFCDNEELSTGPDNLVLKAAAAFRARVPDAPFFRWKLTKRIPWGAGLGGGSSDAAGALKILNKACGGRLSLQELSEVAASVGSDCPLFLHDGPCLMRGRGELLEEVSGAYAQALFGRSVVVVKPHFGVPTGWAYGALDRAGEVADLEKAVAEIRGWVPSYYSLPPLYNSFQKVVFGKYLAYDALNELLRAENLPAMALSGSGSAVFVFVKPDQEAAMERIVRQAWGAEAFFACTCTL